jgi:hypothetical protein
MSLILDALRKSERTRQQSLTGRLGAGETPPARSRMPVPWATLLGLVLLVNAVVLGVLFWRGAAPPPPAAEDKPAAAQNAAPTEYHPSVRPLAAEAGSADTPSVQAPPPAAPSAAAPLPDASAAPAAPTALPPALDTLPQDFRQALPSLHLDVLGYALKPAERFAVINLRHYRIGDTLAEGPTLKDVLPQGAVLEFHGSVFLLPAT